MGVPSSQLSLTSSIHQYIRIHDEKKAELEDRQRHLNIGVEKIRETVSEVEDLRKGLATKNTQLESKNRQANEKLLQMVHDQKEAEAKRVAAIQIGEALEKQEVYIRHRQGAVQEDLALAEPAVLEALAAVGNIKKQHLAEVRSMANPPETVKLAMEATCALLGHQIDNWRAVQSVIRREDFISSIQRFDTETMSNQTRARMMREYIPHPNFNYEVVNRASRACGPLVQWVIAQVRFSEILEQVAPLREEVASLEGQAAKTKRQVKAVEDTIDDLEASISRYKDDYAVLISETQSIRSEMDRVQRTVDRSTKVLESLSSENERWSDGARDFDAELVKIATNALLSAAFIAYAGMLDQRSRDDRRRQWIELLSERGLDPNTNLGVTEYLSNADERLTWKTQGLLSDSVTVENAVILKSTKRYPLIIDPVGDATAYILNKFKVKNLTVTSFLDGAFVKTLESSVRFGTPLLVQDVEHLDPVISPLLNGEMRRTGGRVLVRVGNQDIDFSPSFTLMMITRDSSFTFPPDISSRVTFVNFTITRDNLESQALERILRTEKPEIEARRNDLLRNQAEYQMRLRHLEQALLNALNESSGRVLEDDIVLNSLERTKQEAAELDVKVRATETIMVEVASSTNEYLPLARACTEIYLLLEKLETIHHFYQFSVPYFFDLLDDVLVRNPHLLKVVDTTARRNIIQKDLFRHIYRQVSTSLLHGDHLVLAVVLASIRARAEISDDFAALLEVSASPQPFGASLPSGLRSELSMYWGKTATEGLGDDLVQRAAQWTQSFGGDTPEEKVAQLCKQLSADSSLPIMALRAATLLKVFRPDRLDQGLRSFVTACLGRDVLSGEAATLEEVVNSKARCDRPIILASIAGYDASYQVDTLQRKMNRVCLSVAMGSAECFGLAEQAMAQAARTGNWVLLKNVHLAPSWLGQLEKRLHGLSAAPSFRLFLTTEISPKVPISILRQSVVVMYEPTPGVRANVVNSLRSISTHHLRNAPVEQQRVFFLAAWFHAVCQERLRFVPTGFTKNCDFSDADLDASLSMIHEWIVSQANGKANLDPRHIPWRAVRTLLSRSIYGGRIDSVYDQRALDTFAASLFDATAFNLGHKLIDGINGLPMPEGTSLGDFIIWAQDLPDREPPMWLGLPNGADRDLARREGEIFVLFWSDLTDVQVTPS